VNLDGIDFDMLYAYFMEDDSTSGFIDRQYIEDLISDVKEQERQEKIEKAHPFLDDKEKMRDFHVLSKKEFLNTYSYITSEEYEATQRAVGQGLHLMNESLNKTIYSYNKETNLSEVKQEIEKVLDNNPHVNYTITLTNIDNLKNKKLDEHSSNYPFRAVLNVTTYEQLHPTFGTPIDEKVVYTKDISSLLFEVEKNPWYQKCMNVIEDIKEEQKKGLSHIKGLGTKSEKSTNDKAKIKEQTL
jgi:hypothetical protein